MGDVASPLYPQAPQSPQNSNALLSDPSRAIGLLSQIQDYRIKQQQFPALAQQPQAALTGQNIANTTAQLSQDEAGTQIAAHYLGSLPDNATPDQINRMTMAIRATHPNISAQTINNVADLALKDPKSIGNGLVTVRMMGVSPETMTSRVVAPPAPSGAPQTQPFSTAARAGTQQVGLAPGESELISEPKKAYLVDQERATTTQGNLRKLENVYPLVQQLSNANFGPGSAEFAKIKGALITAGIIDPNTSDLQVRQEVGKYLLNYAQGAANAGRSDHALSAAIGSNPNLDLTQPANLNLVRNQIGMDRADSAIPTLFDQLHPNDANKRDYNKFRTSFYRDYDQRAFTYDMLSPDERRKLIDSLGAKNSPAYRKFAKTYGELKSAGIITPNAQ